MQLSELEVDILMEASKNGGKLGYIADTAKQRMAAKRLIELGLAIDLPHGGGVHFSLELTYEGEKRALEEIQQRTSRER